MACNERIDVPGRATIQAVLELSGQQVAGPRQQGKQRTGEVVWNGQQSGALRLRVGSRGESDALALMMHAAQRMQEISSS